jgi:hypothetical protein
MIHQKPMTSLDLPPAAVFSRAASFSINFATVWRWRQWSLLRRLVEALGSTEQIQILSTDYI